MRLEIVGGGAEERVESLFEGLPVRQRNPRHADAYPNFVPWMRQNLRWDVAIAPLEDDAFTSCKSDLKYLDYGALGIPGVFSDVRPYRDTVRHGETGLLAANDEKAWADALEEIVGDAALRARLAGAPAPKCTAAACCGRTPSAGATRSRRSCRDSSPEVFG